MDTPTLIAEASWYLRQASIRAAPKKKRTASIFIVELTSQTIG